MRVFYVIRTAPKSYDPPGSSLYIRSRIAGNLILRSQAAAEFWEPCICDVGAFWQDWWLFEDMLDALVPLPVALPYVSHSCNLQARLPDSGLGKLYVVTTV